MRCGRIKDDGVIWCGSGILPLLLWGKRLEAASTLDLREPLSTKQRGRRWSWRGSARGVRGLRRLRASAGCLERSRGASARDRGAWGGMGALGDAARSDGRVSRRSGAEAARLRYSARGACVLLRRLAMTRGADDTQAAEPGARMATRPRRRGVHSRWPATSSAVSKREPL